MPQKPREASTDTRSFRTRFQSMLKSVGIELKLHDAAWLQPGGVSPSEYRMVEKRVSEHVKYIRQYKGGVLSAVLLGEMKVWLKVGGSKESELWFELKDSQNKIEVLDHIDATTMDKMLTRLMEMVESKVRAALRLPRQFHLLED